jgi:hypothetical protein
MSLVVPEQTLSFLYEKEFKDKLKRLRGLSKVKETDKYAKQVQKRRTLTLEKHGRQLRNSKPYWQTVIDLYLPQQTGEKELELQRSKLVGMI